MDANKPRKIEISLNEVGHGSIRINDMDISHMTTGVTLVAKVGMATKVRLSLLAPAVEGFIQQPEIRLARDEGKTIGDKSQ